MYKNIYFLPIVIPNYHCKNSEFSSDDYQDYLSSVNFVQLSDDHFTVCADDNLFLDTSYHTSKRLRAVRTAEVMSFVEIITNLQLDDY